MTEAISPARNKLIVRHLDATAPWSAAMLPVSGFPIQETELVPIRQWVDRLAQVFRIQHALESEVFVQVWQLHVGDGPARIQANGRAWIPMLGLGVFPDRKPPTIWSPEEFEDLGPGEMPRTLMYQLLRTTVPSQDERDRTRSVMFGLGTIVQIWAPQVNELLLNRWSTTLLPAIQDNAFRGFAYYVPLLQSGSVQAAPAERLEDWMGGALFYIRESPEDTAIVVLARSSLEAVFSRIGGRRSQDGAEWTFEA